MDRQEIKDKLQKLIDFGSKHCNPNDQRLLDCIALLQEAHDSLDAANEGELKKLSRLLRLLPGGFL